MKKIIFTMFLILISQSVFSQQNKTPGITHTEVTSSSVPDARITEVVKNLNDARLANDLVSTKYWQEKLNQLTSPQKIQSSNDAFNFSRGSENYNPGEVLNLTRITSSTVIANSISRERINGIIFAAIGVYGGPTTPDTLKIYKSTNNGLTFYLMYGISQSELKIDYNGVDAEAVSKGDSAYAFVAMSYTLSGYKSISVIRIREDGDMVSILSAAGSPTYVYSNARITSDNAVFSTSTYIYLSLTLDSVAGGRNLKSKLYYIPDIYASSISALSGYQSNAGGQYGYYVAGISPDSAKFETDIACVNGVGNINLLYTVTVVRGIPGLFGSGTSLHFTRSDTYGTTAPTLFNTTDPGFLKESPRIASTGYQNNSAMVTVRRLYGGGDWDPYYFYTSNITGGAPIFDANYIDEFSDTTTGISVAGRPRSNGSYLFAYNNRRGENFSAVNSRTFNAGVMGSTVQMNPTNVGGTNYYGYASPSFRNVNGDSCLVIWSGPAGNGSYVTGGCSGTVFTGTGNSNSAADNFHLSQNYPNPFNPSTIINYSLPVQSNVSIKIFDVLGKEINSLINEVQTAGIHSVEFNCINLPSGVYYYRIEAGDFADTKKMLLVK
ncbi:MAG: T9SS type A sorting domain-containing protein [Bacteroidetes bacterium]|nr:T9SS type A sorting domain-containing protein [Bacteroidota bacterium]